MNLTISIQGTANETAITKFERQGRDDFDYNKALKAAVANWFQQDDPRWFERDEIFHANGILLDKKTKVTVTCDGKKVDSFKPADCLEIIKVTKSATNFVSRDERGILAMENSDQLGAATVAGSVDSYDRSRLAFEVAVIRATAQYDNLPAIKYYIITGVTGFEWGGVESSEATGRVLTDAGIPYDSPKLEYDAASAARFRTTFLR